LPARVIGITGSVGIDLGFVTNSMFTNLSVTGFDKGVKIGATGVGGRYNRFVNVQATNCATGFSVDGPTANANLFNMCRAGGCQIGLFVSDSTQVYWSGGEIEASSTRAIHITNTSANQTRVNAIIGCRFEANQQNWQFDANVQETQVIAPLMIDATPTANVDNGVRTNVIGAAFRVPTVQQSGVMDPLGSWRFDRTAAAVAADTNPVMSVRDTAATSGAPVVVRASAALAGYPFRAANPAGQTVWDVSSNGVMRLAQAPSAANPPAGMAALYARDNGAGKTQLLARFSDGSIVTIATQP
jgi:hypothetical protein